MKKNEISVVEPKCSPNQDIIERLEFLLEEAKSGDMQGFAYAASYKNLCTGCGYFAPRYKEVKDLLAEIQRVNYWLAKEMDN